MSDQNEWVELSRDCEAVMVPAGHTVLLPQGTKAVVTQSLGGSYTLHVPEYGGLLRISNRDADALGFTVAPETDKPADTGEPLPTEQLEPLVWEQLRTCYDPEIPVNIVDLGLVYDLLVEKLPSGHSKVSVKMTLTAPGCGMGGVIAGDAQQRILTLDGVEEAEVSVVWDPPWHQSMISEQGRRILGLE